MAEVLRELQIGRIHDDDLNSLLAEVQSTFARDPVVSSDFVKQVRCLTPHFAKSDAKKKRDRHALQFDFEDAHADFSNRYFTGLCVALPKAIAANDLDQAYWLTSSLASDLIDRGWSIETLYGWHGHFLKRDGRDFSTNLNFMLRQFQRDPQEFTVLFRVSGSTKLSRLGNHGEFTISARSPITPVGPKETSLCSPNSQVSFATCKAIANYHDDAATSGRTEFEQLLDLLRFEYEHALMTIDDECLVERIGDGKRQIIRLEAKVPNPIESLREDDFVSFANRFNRVTADQHADATSRRLLQAAMRQYRFGRDSTTFKDKFVNWWMGLEALCHTHGEIGKTVAKRTSHCMLQGYSFRLCRDLLTTIKHCQIDWPAAFARDTNCSQLNSLNVPGLVTLMQDAAHASAIKASLTNHPNAERFAESMSTLLQDPKQHAAEMQTHLDRLQWHLTRLYRIRCCIVHGSPVSFELPLFTANLEYYLKRMILFALESLDTHSQINRLDDIYQRVERSNNRNLQRLAETNADAATICDAVFASLVVK